MAFPKARIVFAGILSLVASSCTHGPRAETFPPAHQPGGVAAIVHRVGDSLKVEVIAVQEDGLLLLVDQHPPHALAGKLVRLTLSPGWQGRFEHTGGFHDSFWRYISFWRYMGGRIGHQDMETRPLEAWGSYFAGNAEARDDLRRLSRYPQGVSEDLLARLEETYGEVETFPPGGEP